MSQDTAQFTKENLAKMRRIIGSTFAFSIEPSAQRLGRKIKVPVEFYRCRYKGLQGHRTRHWGQC